MHNLYKRPSSVTWVSDKRWRVISENPNCHFCDAALTVDNSILKRFENEVVGVCSECAKDHTKLKKQGYESFRRGRSNRKRRLKKWKDDPHCFYCNKKLAFLEATEDHVIPRVRGGQTKNNTVIACEECNRRKGEKGAQAFVEQLKDQPYSTFLLEKLAGKYNKKHA
jgi:hypothetical protein